MNTLNITTSCLRQREGGVVTKPRPLVNSVLALRRREKKLAFGCSASTFAAAATAAAIQGLHQAVLLSAHTTQESSLLYSTHRDCQTLALGSSSGRTERHFTTTCHRASAKSPVHLDLLEHNDIIIAWQSSSPLSPTPTSD